MGGVAVVMAYTKEEAIELVQNDPITVDFTNIKVETFPAITESRVVYNDNGDY